MLTESEVLLFKRDFHDRYKLQLNTLRSSRYCLYCDTETICDVGISYDKFRNIERLLVECELKMKYDHGYDDYPIISISTQEAKATTDDDCELVSCRLGLENYCNLFEGATDGKMKENRRLVFKKCNRKEIADCITLAVSFE